MARRATPTAPEATGGLVLSKAPIATLKPMPSRPSTFSSGTTTLSKKSGRVSEHRWPIFTSFSPTLMPGVSASTTNPVMRWSGRVKLRRGGGGSLRPAGLKGQSNWKVGKRRRASK